MKKRSKTPSNLFSIHSDTRRVKKIVTIVLLICIAVPFFSLSDDDYDMQSLISGIQRAGPPVVKNGYIIFTAQKNHRFVGVAFNNEQFRTIHSFERLVFYDTDYEPVDSILFYISKVPEDTETVLYRLIIDGLWTVDPLNPQMYTEPSTNIKFSSIRIEQKTLQATQKTSSGGIRFVYEGESGQTIRLTGSFTGWDPYIYELTETSAGFYELELFLSPGIYYYAYYNGFSSFVDERNPDRAYTKEGKVASILTVR